jgi:hypothetical protein
LQGGAGLGGDDAAPGNDEELLGVTQNLRTLLNLLSAGCWPEGIGWFE